jgi:Skp family chaperone for outer membrane proteins
MKKMMQVCLLAAGLAGWAMSGWAAEQKIAMFNLRKAFDGYYKTIQFNASMRQDKAEMEKRMTQIVENGRKHEDEWRKFIDKANDQSLPAEERDKAKKLAADKAAELEADKQDITAFEREADARLEEKKKLRRDDIVKEIQSVVEAHAKAGGYTMVLDPSGLSTSLVPVVLYSSGQDDMTESVLKELNAAAPPGSLDTNTPAIPPSTNLLPGTVK